MVSLAHQLVTIPVVLILCQIRLVCSFFLVFFEVLGMSFTRDHDTEEDLLVWEEVSFDCSQVFHTIIENTMKSSTCVWDVEYAFIVIPRVVKHVMIGPLHIIVESEMLCIVEDRFGILFTISANNCFCVFFFERFGFDCIFFALKTLCSNKSWIR